MTILNNDKEIPDSAGRNENVVITLQGQNKYSGSTRTDEKDVGMNVKDNEYHVSDDNDKGSGSKLGSFKES